MIDSYSFGKIVISGVAYSNDVKIIGGSVIAEWWRKKGHSVLPDDVGDMVDSQPEVVVIGKGKPGMMHISTETKRLFEEKGIQLIEEKTSRAVRTFNRLHREGKRVCAGFHLTC